MLLIGLTGSIATGKSTCATLLTSPPHSLPLIDADILARQVVEPGTWGYNRIVRTFGSDTPNLLLPDPEGKHRKRGAPLNRPALGRLVFGSDPDKVAARHKLNRIVHPAVRLAMLRALLYYYLLGHWAVVVDVPLLFESGLDIFCGTVVVVAVHDPRVQMRRLMERDAHLTEEDARNRVGSQVDVRVKAERAEGRGVGRGYVCWNDGGKRELEEKVARVVGDIRSESPRWWSGLLWVCPPLMVGKALWEVVWAWSARRNWEAQNKKSGGGTEMAKPKL